MRTHVKESLVTVATFLALVGAVNAGIWFHLFGVPDVTVLNWPFHYFWFVVGAWLSIAVVYGIYHRVVVDLEAEKRGIREAHGELDGRGVAPVEDHAPESGGDR